MEDFRKVFDLIPEQFDKWRQRYCSEAFSDIIKYSALDASKSALEIGPGTGQATEPILETGCNYLAIELGEHLARFCKNKFSDYKKFSIINDDFETHNFGDEKFDLVYSAATIQWIPEEVGFPKVFDLLKSGGTFAMMYQKGDYKTPNEELYHKIQAVYAEYFHPEHEYTCNLAYENVVNYGFTDYERKEYHFRRKFTADEYISYTGTHCTHITLKEPERSLFFNGIKNAIIDAGNELVQDDVVVLYLVRKP